MLVEADIGILLPGACAGYCAQGEAVAITPGVNRETFASDLGSCHGFAAGATQISNGYDYVSTMESAAQTPNSDLGLDKNSSMESATQTLNSDLGLCTSTDLDNLNSKLVSLVGDSVKLASQLGKLRLFKEHICRNTGLWLSSDYSDGVLLLSCGFPLLL